MSVSLIIPAGGIGKRFSNTVKKQYYLIDNKPIIYWTIKNLITAFNFDEVIFGVADENKKLVEDIVAELKINCNILYSSSGKERANTVYNALKQASSEYVVIHDAVRPYVSSDTVVNCINEAEKTGGAICGIFAKDSVKLVEGGIIKSSLNRETVFLAYTPQVFLRERLISCYEGIFAKGLIVTDDAGAYESAGYRVSVVLSNPENIKITYIDDIRCNGLKLGEEK